MVAQMIKQEGGYVIAMKSKPPTFSSDAMQADTEQTTMVMFNPTLSPKASDRWVS